MDKPALKYSNAPRLCQLILKITRSTTRLSKARYCSKKLTRSNSASRSRSQTARKSLQTRSSSWSSTQSTRLQSRRPQSTKWQYKVRRKVKLWFKGPNMMLNRTRTPAQSRSSLIQSRKRSWVPQQWSTLSRSLKTWRRCRYKSRTKKWKTTQLNLKNQSVKFIDKMDKLKLRTHITTINFCFELRWGLLLKCLRICTPCRAQFLLNRISALRGTTLTKHLWREARGGNNQINKTISCRQVFFESTKQICRDKAKNSICWTVATMPKRLTSCPRSQELSHSFRSTLLTT